MNLCLDRVLDIAALREIRAALAQLPFADGTATAGWHARAVKHNLQARHPQLGARVQQALQAHPLLQAAALPARMREPLFSRCVPGMGYGNHIDDALMGRQEPLRTDLAVTVFLSDPAAYDGGELVLDGHSGVQAYKLDAGQALLYPATTVHRVEPVVRGERLVAVLWIQSFVRDASQREVLFDLDTARRQVWEQAGGRATPTFELLAKSYANLLRAWAQT